VAHRKSLIGDVAVRLIAASLAVVILAAALLGCVYFGVWLIFKGRERLAACLWVIMISVMSTAFLTLVSD
jgi:hypothetical protein